MPNEINKALETFLPFGIELGKGFDKARNTGKLQDLFNVSIEQLTGYLRPQPIRQTGMTGDDINPPQEVAPDFKQGLNYLYQQAPKFAEFGEQGNPYLKSLQGFFEGTQELNKPIKKDIREGNDGRWYDVSGDKPVLYGGEPKPEKKKYTVGDYSKMTAEDVMKLDENEFWDAFKFVPEDVRNELLKNPFVQQEYDRTFKENDFASKIKTRSSGFGKTNFKDSQTDDLAMFNNLNNYNKTLRSGQELSDDIKKSYNTARLTLGQKYNLNDTQLAKVIERLDETTNAREKQKILNSLEKGDYYENVGTSQPQMEYDRNRIKEWQKYLNDIYTNDPNNYDGVKQNFLKELQDFYYRGSLTKKEYDDLIKSYF